MTQRERRIPLLGSERAPVSGAKISGKPKPNELVRVTVILRPTPSAEGQVSAEEIGARLPRERTYLGREDFEAVRGASREDIAKVEAFATRNALDVVEVSPARRSVVLSGTVAQLGRAFGIELVHYKNQKGTYRGHEGPVNLPEELAPVVKAVLGLDNRPQATPHVRIAKKGAGASAYTPPQVGRLYDFPSGLNGAGESIAIVELGGGYALGDIQAYFSSLGLAPPSVTSISVDGATNAPTGDAGGPDGEVMLDVEVAGGVAPKAQIAVYFAPNTEQGFLDAVTTAIHDRQHSPSVMSISWGSPEAGWSQQGMDAMNGAFEDAALLGVTVCVASGDNGSSDGMDDGLAHVDFPASSPYVLGGGGTRLKSKQNRVTSETVWNDLPRGGATGGGVSDVFPVPSWQATANVPPSANPRGRVGRGVPDVCADADPMTGFTVRVDGEDMTVGGTSAVAPLWAGLIALVNQKLGKQVGYLNPLIYGLPAQSKALRDITSGNNGAYSARQGWDPCTGLGSPDGTKLISSLSP